MPNAKKKLNAGTALALLFVVLMIGTIFMDISSVAKLVIVIGLMVVFVLLRISYVFFLIGANAMKKPESEAKAWKNLERALKLGIDDERKVMIGSAYIQQGDPKRGVEILESIGIKRKSSFRSPALVTASMGYWRMGQLDKAIEMLQQLWDEGYRDKNLSVNLETYLLQRGDLDAVKKNMKEAREGQKVENNGLMDNRGWYYLLKGEWDRAQEVYDDLIDERNARFPEAYLHGAQVSVHLGKLEQAIDRLSWGCEKKFPATCIVSEQYFEKLLLGLENPQTREAFAAAMEQNVQAVAIGEDFAGLELAVEFDRKAEGVLLPKSKETSDAAKQDSTSDPDSVMNTDVDDDDREPNTDLDDEDYALEAAEGSEEDSDESMTLNTDVDDDEREPNTDLDENE